MRWLEIIPLSASWSNLVGVLVTESGFGLYAQLICSTREREERLFPCTREMRTGRSAMASGTVHEMGTSTSDVVDFPTLIVSPALGAVTVKASCAKAERSCNERNESARRAAMFGFPFDREQRFENSRLAGFFAGIIDFLPFHAAESSVRHGRTS